MSSECLHRPCASSWLTHWLQTTSKKDLGFDQCTAFSVSVPVIQHISTSISPALGTHKCTADAVLWVPICHSPCHCPQAPRCLVSVQDISFTEDRRTGQIENASRATDSGSNTAYTMGLKQFFFHLFKVWWVKTCSFSRGKGFGKVTLLAWAFQSKVLFFQNASC